jgi:hypothetical protein
LKTVFKGKKHAVRQRWSGKNFLKINQIFYPKPLDIEFSRGMVKTELLDGA